MDMFSIEFLDTSAVVAYKLLPNGHLEYINSITSQGGAPCHITLTPHGNFLLISNYFGGSISVAAIDHNTGGFDMTCNKHQKPIQNIPSRYTHSNKQPNRNGPHVHQSLYIPHTNLVLVCDLGYDMITTYLYNEQRNTVNVLTELSRFIVLPGSGPRHMVLNKQYNYLYVVNELSNTVCVLRIDKANGLVSNINPLGHTHDEHYYTVLPLMSQHLCDEFASAEILIHKNNKYLYVSVRDVKPGCNTNMLNTINNRTRDAIIVFAILDDGARLERIQEVSSCGSHPRGMCLHEIQGLWKLMGACICVDQDAFRHVVVVVSQRPIVYHIVANKDSNTITVYDIDGGSGKLCVHDTSPVIWGADCDTKNDTADTTTNASDNGVKKKELKIVEPTWIQVVEI